MYVDILYTSIHFIYICTSTFTHIDSFYICTSPQTWRNEAVILFKVTSPRTNVHEKGKASSSVLCSSRFITIANSIEGVNLTSDSQSTKQLGGVNPR